LCSFLRREQKRLLGEVARERENGKYNLKTLVAPYKKKNIQTNKTKT
jgi:hypothetical protein